jgi:hypothetical protein
VTGTSKKVSLDERFIASSAINDQYPLHVIATPTSDCGYVWVEKKFDNVIVHTERPGSVDITISARRRGFESIYYDEKVLDELLDKWYKKSDELNWLETKPVRIAMKIEHEARQRAKAILTEESRVRREEKDKKIEKLRKSGKLTRAQDKKLAIRKLEDDARQKKAEHVAEVLEEQREEVLNDLDFAHTRRNNV